MRCKIVRMRLTPFQRQAIKSAVASEFEPGARIWLFGSRIDDARRGGDIDLMVETCRPGLLQELRCRMRIEEALDLHVDLIASLPDDDRPISRIARREGIRL